ncbi:MAG: ABC transporter substrate-binding protein [Cyanobacteria bacterium J06592_8]
MMMNWIKRGLIVSLSLILMACSPNTPSTVSTNNLTETVIERVVTLSSLTADLTQQLSAEKLVGIPGSKLLENNPKFAGIKIVSGGRTQPNLETIVALEPDLVLGAAGFHDQIGKRLEEIGIPTILTEVRSWESLTKITTDLATYFDVDPQPVLEQYQSCLEKAPNVGKSVLVLVSRQPILSPNQDSWAGDFLQQFQSENLAANLQGNSEIKGYVTLSAEKILQADPDVILVIDPGQAGILEQFQNDPFWGKLQASTTEQVYAFDYYGLVNPGSLETIEQACDRLSKILSQE